VDGATLDINGRRFQLADVTAPSANRTCRKEGATIPCSIYAAEQLTEYIDGRDVSCEAVKQQVNEPILAKCFIYFRPGQNNRVDLGFIQVRQGSAMGRGGYALWQGYARSERRGIWASQ